MTLLRADMHVHTCHSRQSGTLPFLRSRDCYSEPSAVYRTAKSRGMDLVAITDHDSIDGALELLSDHPDADDIILAEEVSCRFTEGDIEVHLGVYGMTETLHRELQPLRGDVFDVIARLREADVFFALNHLLHFYRGQAPLERYLRLLDEVPAVEARNGTMVAAHNCLVEAIAARWRVEGRAVAGLPMIAGSDAHTLRRIGRTWTEAPGRNRREFVESLRRGLGRPGGQHGGAGVVAADAYGVIARYIASLLGAGPRDHAVSQRLAYLAFVVGSVPFQFLPWLIALAGKWREANEVARSAGLLRLTGEET